jgi:DNA-binding HxlR family transcriptional regulator
MLLEGRQTFKDFLESDEAIATNILSSRLKMLEEWKIITKQKLPDNKKTHLYRLTDKGLALTPIIVELALWSDGQIREFHPELRDEEGLESMRKNKEEFIQAVRQNYREQPN